jgi:hypothetical protein
MRTPDLTRHGLAPAGPVFAHLSVPELVEHALRRGEGNLADNGALNALTGERTARSPKDKYTVRDPSLEKEIDWTRNKAMSPELFDRLLKKALAYANSRELFVLDAAACAEPDNRLTLRVVAEQAWHALFARCLFRLPTVHESAGPSLRRGRGGAQFPRRHRAELRAEDPARRRHPLRRRDQEVDLLGADGPVADEGRLPDALLGQHRQG